MTRTIRWGILGTGAIAHKFAAGLNDLPDTCLLAVGSRNQSSADAFADAFAIPKRYGSYEALVHDAELDVIYIATPHAFHKEHSLLCLEAGKAVLCEKPFALNLSEAQEMVAAARQHDLFLMEAMWTRFLPHMVKLRELLAEGVLGRVRLLQADFGFRAGINPEHRLFDPDLGGGALLDVGVYPVALAHELFGSPVSVSSSATLGDTGVDEEAAMLLTHANGELALLSTAIRLNTPHEATIIGTKGRIRIPNWWRPSTLELYLDGSEPEKLEVGCLLNGYNYEALEVNRCLREGELESGIMPLEETLAITTTLDALRAQWGLRYPVEA